MQTYQRRRVELVEFTVRTPSSGYKHIFSLYRDMGWNQTTLNGVAPYMPSYIRTYMHTCIAINLNVCLNECAG
ncbi:CLUMA_CG008137, isoform A [Clunio marinus]|uniref:CLUMA_CG008137, isoform A n=1 Tax=Clunio marinus TaxID=568069 RepID=A0A1J1I2X6_9DIPT|nr:CLUMA_CG008137, isoform A [Clunio marinus]